MNRGKQVKNIFLFILSFCGALILCDAVARPFLAKYIYYRPEDFLSRRSLSVKSLDRYKPNSSCEWESFGDLAAMTGDKSLRRKRRVRFETDPNGFRNQRDANISRPYDVLVLGDSFALGCGVSQEKTWSSLLESRYGLKTYNFSMHGGGPWQEYINLNLTLDKLRFAPATTILWVLFPSNDLDDEYGPTLEIGQLPEGNAWIGFWKTVSRYFKRSPIRQLLLRCFHESKKRSGEDYVIIRDWPVKNKQKILFFRPYAERKDQPYGELKDHPNYQHLNEVITAMKDFTEKKKIGLKVVIAPSKEEIYDWALHKKEPWSMDRVSSARTKIFEELCRSHGIETLDLYPLLKKTAQEVYGDTQEPIYWYDDTHWNETGQEIVAKIIDELLKR